MSESLRDKVMEIVNDLPSAVRKGLVHPDYKHHDPVLPNDIKNSMTSAEAYAEGARTFERSFPDYKSEPKWILTDDDKTAVRWIWTGTFTGEAFQNIEPTGKKIVFEGMTMFRWENGQVVEGMTLYDSVGFELQLRS